MKTSAQDSGWGFSLIELLVVIAIIGILAALLLVGIAGVKKKALVRIARLDMAQIVTAIQDYEQDCSKFPVSSTAMDAAGASGQGFTFGTQGLSIGLMTPGGNYDVRALDAGGAPLSYQANNSEVMAVLLDIETWPGPPRVATINQGHVKNPTKKTYLTATMSGNTFSPGVGSDGVFRDPWGQPYIITLDLNDDHKARDAFYREPSVSADPSDPNTPPRGLNGLLPAVVGGKTFYEANAVVMVWSAGPDKMVDPGAGITANQGANKDNVVSWK